MDSAEIQIPPRPEYVGVLRLALGSLARTVGMDEESIDDLRIAISEACTNAVIAQEENLELLGRGRGGAYKERKRQNQRKKARHEKGCR